MSERDAESDTDLEWTRRQVLTGGGFAAAALLAGAATCSQLTGRDRRKTRGDAHNNPGGDADHPEPSDWQDVRHRFDADPAWVHMAGMLLSTHPQRVRDAIERHRRGLDENPVDYLNEHRQHNEHRLDDDAEQWAMEAAARYLEMDSANIALVGSTTQGLATVYNGLTIDADQEVVTGHWNHWATEGSLQYRAQKTGFDIRRASLYDDLHNTSEDELVDRLIDQVSAQTRVVAVTWVHSVSGLKLPVGRIGRRIEELNETRALKDRILYCVDGVHGFGVEDAAMADFHCDFFISGCHKWLFGPRGTGIIAAAPDAWQFAIPTVPTFSSHMTPGRRFTPGGFHAYEHRWALNEAFGFHADIGKGRIEERIHGLARHCIEELAAMNHVRLRTPTDPALSSGIVTFQVDGFGTYEVTGHLRRHGVIASTTPQTHRIPRLSPGLLNDHDEVDQTLAAIRELG